MGVGYDFDDEEQRSEGVDDADEQPQLDADDIMSEAEKRFALAMYYRELMKTPIFQDGSEEAETIAAEVREFARERMSVLLGLPGARASQEAAQGQFDPEEVRVLKGIARSALNRVQVATVAPPAPPKVVQASAPQKPAVIRPQQPERRKEAAPEPEKPAAKPARKISVKKPTPKASEGGKKRRPEDVPDGEIFKQGGKFWKWESLPGPPGCPCANCAAGQPHRFRRDVSIQRQSPKARPMPQGAALEMATADLAQRTIEHGAAILDKKMSRNGGLADEIVLGDGTIRRNYDPDQGMGNG